MFPLDTISAELHRVFASVHMSEPVSSTPAIPPDRAWSSDERERIPRNVRPHHRWRQSRPTFAAEKHKITLLRLHSGTRLRRSSIQRTRTMTALTPLIRAICRNTCEMNSRCWPPAWTMVKTMLRFQVWDNSKLETACLKLAELPEALAIVQVASDQNRHCRASPGGKGKARQSFGRQRVVTE